MSSLLTEYYDELYTVTLHQKSFFKELISAYPFPQRLLSLWSGTGVLEQFLCQQGVDVIGTETEQSLLETALRRKKLFYSNLRYLHMTFLELTSYLPHNHFNAIFALHDKITLITEPELITKFFFDCRKLLKPNGTLVLHLQNYALLNENTPHYFPELTSVRIKLIRFVRKVDTESHVANHILQIDADKSVPIVRDRKIVPYKKADLELLAQEAGFSSFEYFADYEKHCFESNSAEMICIIR